MGPEDTVSEGGSIARFSARAWGRPGCPPRSTHPAEAASASAATAQGTRAPAGRGGADDEGGGHYLLFFRQLDPGVGDVVQPVLRVALEAAPQKPSDARRTPAGRPSKSGAVFRTAASTSETRLSHRRAGGP